MRIQLPLAVCLLLLTTSASAATLDADWSTSPGELDSRFERPLRGFDGSVYQVRHREVTRFEGTWNHFFVFYEGDLIAQGMRRTEEPRGLRVGTISDIVSYDNEYKMAERLVGHFGEPDFKEVRTRSEFSQELGDAQLRLKRAVHWDLQGERWRWNLDDSVLRYAVRYSLKGVRAHKVVRVKSGDESKYFNYLIHDAFRRAGIDIIQRFERRSRKMIVAMVTASGESARMEVDGERTKIVPVQAEKSRRTFRDCTVQGHPCTVTVYRYGWHPYKVVFEMDDRGEISRRARGALEKAGERNYDRFLYVDNRLEDIYGSPTNTTAIPEKKLNDDRKLAKVHRLPEGMEAFWSVWYDPSEDLLVRHDIHGQNSGLSWSINHRLTFRLHSVTRAFAEQRAWDQETSAIESQPPERPAPDSSSKSESDDKNGGESTSDESLKVVGPDGEVKSKSTDD